jgi:hypothetical protein
VAPDPRPLVAGAAGLVAAVLLLWALRGLPLGAVALWAVPLPLFLAGMGFGAVALLGALAVAALAVLLSGSSFVLGILLAVFGVPSAALVLAAGEGERRALGLPLALLGLMPAGGIAIAAMMLADAPGGLEGALRLLAETALQRMGLPAGAPGVPELDALVRVKAAAIGFWLVVMLLANAVLAGLLLARAGIASAPAWREARLPVWYAAVPAIAAGFWLAADQGADAVPLSILLATLVPVFLHGLAAFHRITRALRGRAVVLAGAYAALIWWAVPVALSVTGFGLYDLLNRARGTPPRGS